ncbi:MAG TPA: hypothetical protein DCQ31_01205 [Bacteroidales bacterium]|nr:hypothetical protein [Bacteroidales bacterium]
MRPEELLALIKLIEDPDEIVFEAVSKRLIEAGSSVVAELERQWTVDSSPLLNDRILNLVREIQFNATCSNLKAWYENDYHNLLEGLLIVSSYQYPEMNRQLILEKYARIEQAVWLELNNEITALEQVKVLNHILFKVNKFGNSKTPYSPENYFINQVIDTQKGNSMSLALLYMVVANKLGIPLGGVNLLGNYILAYVDQNAFKTNYDKITHNEILFYINPYNKGAVLGKREIDIYLTERKQEILDKFYIPVDNRVIIKQLLDDLIFAYGEIGYTHKADEIKKMMDML